MSQIKTTNNVIESIKRARLLYVGLFMIMAIFGLRLFYLQVIKHSYYKTAALSDQLKQYQIPAKRGSIYVLESGQKVPIVLSQKLYTLFADPGYIKDAQKTAEQIAAIIGGQASDYISDLTKTDTRYVVIKKKLSDEQQQRIAALNAPGIGTVEQSYRTYPQANLASQLLGFVNDDGVGTYGIEQALNKELAGMPGELKAITDSDGVPLAASPDNIDTPAKDGDGVVLTVDIAMQQQLEAILAQGLKDSESESGSALIMDPKTGAVKAMANYPTYDPSNYTSVTDASLFTNPAVSKALEIGSTMKPFTVGAAINSGVVKADTSYYDPAKYKVNDFTITNIEEDGPAGQRSIKDILNLSLNTGATWLLMQMGGGEINEKARNTWYDYMTQHYLFGKATGIEQGYESDGYVPTPQDNGAGINLTYANTTFGQAMTATPIQMGAAMSALVNGGTYYQPHLVYSTVDDQGKETIKENKVVKSNIVSADVSQSIRSMMQYTVENHSFVKQFDQNNYTVGGKTGTAQVAKPEGGYSDTEFNGTYIGFVGGDTPEYVIVVVANKPKIWGYAGSRAAQPIFGTLAHMLINNFNVAPKAN